MFVLRVTVKDGERAFLMRNGRLEQVLGARALFAVRHQSMNSSVESFNVVRAEFRPKRYAVLSRRGRICSRICSKLVGDERRRNSPSSASTAGPLHLMAPWQTRVFWKVATRGRMSSASMWRPTRRSRRGILP